MSSKRKFKRDYIILEAKDMNFRYKERILPKAFAKIEVNDEKSVVALYVENLKYMKDGYRVVAIRSDYETIDLGKITLNEQGKGEFVLNLEDKDAEIKGIALLYDKTVPLIGFKGNKIENYEEILFMGDEDDYIETDDEVDEYEEIEYIEVEDDEDGDYEEYEEIEYIEVEEDDNLDGYGDTDDEYEFDESVDGDIDYDNVENKYHEYQNINDDNGLEYNRTNRIPRQNKTIKEKVKQYRSPINKAYQGINYQDDINETQQERNTRPQGTLLMPRQIKKGLKYFREVKPFVEDYVDNTRWWKIDITPATLCGYTMPYLGYVNSLNYTMYSDAIMQSYKYRHYLFGVQYEEYNKRKNYIYAVPGKKDEQPDKGHTGFTTYQPCDNRGNSLGYWLCYIDSRTRNILK